MRVNRKTCSLKLQSYMAQFGPTYPWNIGKYNIRPIFTSTLCSSAPRPMCNSTQIIMHAAKYMVAQKATGHLRLDI